MGNVKKLVYDAGHVPCHSDEGGISDKEEFQEKKRFFTPLRCVQNDNVVIPTKEESYFTRSPCSKISNQD